MIERVSTGLCNKNCPVYKASLKHRYSPRGFIQLIDEGVYDIVLYTCTLCGNCSKDNPVDFDFLKVFRKARVKLVEEGKEVREFKIMIDNLKRTGNIYGIDA